MDGFWQGHWWLLIILASFTIPLAGIAMGAWSTWLYFRNRRAAMDTLREYAAQGREPPKEVVDALTGGFRGHDWYGDEAPDYGDRASRYADRAARRAERFAARAERWRYREPLRRWHWAILWGALAFGLYYASGHMHDGGGSDRYLTAAIIVGAIAAAALLSAILSTIFRPK
jgi:hypothetical protein